MVNIVKSGLAAPESTLPGPIKLKTKAGDVYKRAMDDQYVGQRGVGVVAAYALAGSEENARGHLVVTAPTGGSAGVIPALVYVLGEGGRKLPQEKIREGLLAAAVIGYLCKHNATLAGAEGGCQAEIGVASAMGAALIAQAHDFDHQVIANAAESSLEHHLGLTCDPVAGFVQIPCIERCAYGAVKAWTGFMIASNEIPVNRRVDFDTTVDGDGAHGQGDELQVQGDLRRRSGRLAGALLAPDSEERAACKGGADRLAGHRGVLLLPVRHAIGSGGHDAGALDGFGLSAAAVASLVGLFYYGYSPFSLVAGVAMDRLGPRRVVPIGAATVGVGALLFASGDPTLAGVGRFLQGAGGVFALIGAAYIATTNFPASRAATLIGATQMFGMAGGSAGQFVVGPMIERRRQPGAASGPAWASSDSRSPSSCSLLLPKRATSETNPALDARSGRRTRAGVPQPAVDPLRSDRRTDVHPDHDLRHGLGRAVSAGGTRLRLRRPP